MSLKTDKASAETGDGQHQPHLTFLLGEETFAIGILRVKEIIEYGSLTVVPLMPGCVRGVINLRGAVVPVIDLAARFGRGATQITRRSCIVIIEVGNAEERQDVGLIVDAVNEVIDIHPGQIEPPPAFGARIRTDFIAGMGKLDNCFVIILDVDRMLSFEELAAFGEAAHPAPHLATTAAAATASAA